MTNHIHPTACIADNVKLGDAVIVGPYVVIEPDVVIGEGCEIQAHAVIKRFTQMGSSNRVHSHVVLGDLPQDIAFKAATVSYLTIGDNNVFREGFTAHRATVVEGATIIGSQCFFMNHSHVAHDCMIGDQTIFANNVAIGGFVEVGNNVFMGGAVVAHQFCRVGPFAIVRGTSGLSMDVLPFTTAGGAPAKHYRLNSIGLRRAGISGERYKMLTTAFRRLKAQESIEDLEDTPEILILKAWLAVKSKRGVHGFK
ncbi:MAG: acyl-ACP--UDP-N-acetylglucosamine O-acyltransferase [Methylococcales bacterium]|nr:acyl-ACP--UDP-N-acetylglucosamine O-acyltransferase [Methylococcales bacterium]